MTTCNNIILSQPVAGSVMNHEIPSDVSARLNFGPQDIAGLRMGSEGELVISFVDGGQLNLTNFDDLVDNGNLLYLEDGTLIDPSILTSSLTSPLALNNIESAAGADSTAGAIKLAQPAANTTQEVSLQAGQKYVCDFDPKNAATVEVKDGQMILTFADGSQVVINNYADAMAGDLPAELTLTDGTVIDGAALITSAIEIAPSVEEVLEVAEETEDETDSSAAKVAKIAPAYGEDLDSVAEALQQIEPAAGDGAASNSGYGFNSSPVDVPLDSPDAIGPLGPTALRYNAPQFQQEFLRLEQEPLDPRPIVSTSSALLDETNLSGGNIVAKGAIIANFGGDGAGAYTGSDDFTASCELTGGILSSGGVPIVVTFDAGTNTYTGVAGATTVFTMEIDLETGEYTYTQIEPFDHADTTNDNEDICLTFGVDVSDGDGDITSTNIEITVLDDAPVVFSQIDSVVDETNLTGGNLVANGSFVAEGGQDGPATYAGTNNFNATGSVDNGALTSNGVAIVVTYDAGTNTYTGDAGGTTVFTLAIDPATGDYTYTQIEPIDHADDTNPDDVITLEFGASITDFDGDVETGIITVLVRDDAPETGDDVNSIDESYLSGGPIVVNDSVSVDFGGDGAGSLLPSGVFTPTGSIDNGILSHGGSPITVTQTVNGYEGVDGNGLTIFTLDINPTTGDYTFTLLESLDHADDTDPNDVITLTFGTVISDFEGDTEGGQIVINVADDAPEFQTSGPKPDEGLETVDETNLDGGPLVETGTLNADFGVDAPGTYDITGTFTPSGSLLGGNLTSGGFPVTVGFDDGTNTYTGSANGASVFTLVVDPNTGDYTYTQTGVLDHADGADANDVITLTFGVNAVDSEGEAASGSIVINVVDDAPILNPAYNTVDETDLGPIVVNSSVTPDYGNDGPATVDSYDATGNFNSSGSQLGGALTSNGVPVIVAFDADTNTYTGTAGGNDIFEMVVNADGSYSFTLTGTLDHADPNDPNDIINLDFGIGATDFDSDTAESFIRIQVKDDVPTIGDSSGDVDETNLDGGPLVYQDVVANNSGQSITSINPDGNTSSSTPLLYNGAPVVVSQTANGYEGVSGGTTIFTLTINPVTGQYTYTQFEPLDHPDSTNPNDLITINFGIEIEAFDGTTDDGTITINIADDGPVAEDDINGAEEGQLITGNVTANDDLSEDTDNNVTNVNFNGTDYPIVPGGSAVIDADYGTLTINSDGTYQYVTDNNDPDGTDVFTYTLTDQDGDQDTATLSITVTPDGQPVAVSELLAVDETNLTPGPMIFNGDVNVDFGIDGAGSVTPNGSFTAGGSLLGGTLTSGGVPVVVNVTGGNTYTGTAGGTTVFTVLLNTDGTYTFQLFEHIDHADNTDPNDVITLEFGITAADADGDTTDGTFTVLVYDDAPVAYDDGTTTLDESQTVTGNVTDNDELSEDRPNDVVEVIFNGVTTIVPSVGTAVINGQYGVLTIDSTGAYSYKANDNNPDGTDTFTYILEDFDGDRDTAEISFKTNPLNDTPIIIKPVVKTVDDTDLDGGPNIVGGTVSANYFGDGPGEINPNGDFSSDVANLSSNGNLITVNLVGNTYTGTANGVTVFTMTIAEDGTYSFTQFEPLTHPDTTDHNDALMLSFGVTATDKDGDAASTTVMVRILDDGPSIGTIAKRVYEGDINGVNPAVVTNTVPHDFGEDEEGAITSNGSFAAKFQVGGPDVTLQSQGDNIVVSNTNNGYVGTADGRTVFTLEIDPLTGEYTFKLFDQIDHPDKTNPDDVIWLKFGVTITDNDGDTDTGMIIIDVHDDGPMAVNDKKDAVEGGIVTGNVINNDDVGTDEPGFITKITFDGVTTVIPQDGSNIVINGDYGVLTINNTGAYSYTAGNVVVLSTDVFTYTLVDFDGDASQANLKICVDDKAIPTEIKGAGQTDDTDLGNGPNAITGNITVNYNGDGPGTTSGNGNFAAEGNLTGGVLQSNGSVVNVSFDAGTNTYTGLAAGLTVFTLTVNSDGTFAFTQFEQLDHSDTTNHNEDLLLRFGVTATDNGGDEGTGEICIKVLDDGPVISNSVKPVNEADLSGGPVVINRTLNHNFGEDGQGTIEPNGTVMTLFKVGGANQTFTAGGVAIDIQQTADGYIGTAGGETIFDLVIDPATGEYTYTQYEAIDHPGVDKTGTDDVIWIKFGVTITDFDGDTDTAFIQIDIRDDGPVANDDDIAEDKDTVTGNVTDNDDFGADGAGCVTTVEFDGQVYDIPETGTRTIEGNFGTLEIDATGAYTYTQKPGSGGTTTTTSFDITSADVDGINDSISQNGITIQSNSGQDLTWFSSTDLGSGAGIAGGSTKVFGSSEVLEVLFENGAETATFTIADMGSNNIGNTFKYDAYLASDPTTPVSKTVLIEASMVSNGTFVFDVGGNGDEIVRVDLVGGPSFALTSVDIKNTDNVDTKDSFIYTIKDDDGDTASAELCIKLTPNNTPIIVKPGVKTVDETDLAGGNNVVSGVVSVDYQGDGPGEVNPNGSFSSSISNLKSCGYPVTVSVSGNTYTGLANGVTVFTLNVSNNGNYTFTQIEALDHPDTTDHNDDLMLSFGVTATDADGDTAETTVMIKVLDDGPEIHTQTSAANESALDTGPIVITKTLNHSFGEDGSGTIEPNGTVMTLFKVGGTNQPLTTGGVTIDIQETATGYVGIAGGKTIFTLSINPTTGKYTYTQNEAIDHPGVNATGTSDVIWIKFGVTITDKDGDTDTAFVQIDIRDDGPVAHDDTDSVGATDGAMATGNVLTNDDAGNDDTLVTVTNPGTYTGTFGTLVLNTNGTYKYTRTGDTGGVDTFHYTMSDADGDTSSAKLTVTVPVINDNTPIIVKPGIKTVDETDLAGGNNVVSGVVSVDYQGDGPGEVNPNGSFSSSLTNLKSCGYPVTVSVSGNTYTGVANGVTVFTLTVAENGNYTFTQIEALDHPNTADHNDALLLNFGVTATDADGDAANTIIRINVLDDGPVISTQTSAANESALDNGPIVINKTIPHNFGEDEAGTIEPNGTVMTLFKVGGTNQTLTMGGQTIDIQQTANGYVGKSGTTTVFTLSINPTTGAYKYTQFEAIDHPGVDATVTNDVIWLKFGVTITDCDGDTATAFVQIDIRDDGPVAHDDAASIARFSNSATGNVLTNDDAGNDDTSVRVTTPGTYNGTFGTLVINANGTYTYTRFGRAGGTDTFNYTMRDADGDTDVAQLAINVTANPAPPPPPPSGDGGGDGGGDGCPLVIDLDGDGIELISKENGVLFDIDEDGIADKTAWVGADDGILVRDINEDGIINDHSEMFGNDEIGGFEMLAQHDDNQDGIINAKDAIWKTLMIWQDVNGDAFSQADEFITFDELGIAAINLAVKEVGLVIAGNDVTVQGDFITEDGDAYAGYDAWFQYDSGDGAASEADAFIFEAIQESSAEILNIESATEDVIDLSSLVQGGDDVTEAINNFVHHSDTALGAEIASVNDNESGLEGLSDKPTEDLANNLNDII